jgi:hypothetical protein
VAVSSGSSSLTTSGEIKISTGSSLSSASGKLSLMTGLSFLDGGEIIMKSCDSTSNYFNFWFDGLQPERYYKFVFKIEDNTNGTTKFYDDNFYFKVIR